MGDRWAWFDLENTPHVLFLAPFVRRLRADGVAVRVTAKPQSQTLALAERVGLQAHSVGRGDLASRSGKLMGGVGRVAELVRWARAQPGRPLVQIQSSRTASLAARVLGVPAVGLLDYEKAVHWPMAVGCRSLWFPDLLSGVPLPALTRRVARFFPGLKENLYLDGEPLDRWSARRTLGVAETDFLVVARPPADTAHYATHESSVWWHAAVRDVLDQRAACVHMMPRGPRQAEALARTYAGSPRVVIIHDVVQGPALVAAADLVIGGGGTMNREAAVVGTMAWSTFAGPRPHVDECLAREGRLRWINSAGELEAALGKLGIRPAPRGPYAEGFQMILADIRRYLPMP